MTPAINAVNKAKIEYTLHEYAHQSSSQSYGKEAASKLGLHEQQVFKTLVVKIDNKQLVVCVIPVASSLSMKKLAKFAGAKKAMMAAHIDVERSTGYVLGGVSPLGQKRKLTTYIASSANNYSSIYVSAGRRGLEIELSPNDLARLLSGRFADITQ